MALWLFHYKVLSNYLQQKSDVSEFSIFFIFCNESLQLTQLKQTALYFFIR